MSRRWTLKEDQYLALWYHEGGVPSAWHMANDLRRSEEAVKARVKALREAGAWEDLTAMRDAELIGRANYYAKMHPGSEAHANHDEGIALAEVPRSVTLALHPSFLPGGVAA